MNEKLRAAVIGVGVMGQHHVRAYREMPDVELVGFADADEANRTAIEQRHHVRGYADYHQLLDEQRPDIVTVAVPTVFHREVAEEALSRSIHVLIEKPIAELEADAQALIALAKERHCVLAVGHIERHNPAIKLLKTLLDAGRLGPVYEMHAERMGPFPARIRDVGVIYDLATHDIDILCYLAGSKVAHVYAETQQNIHSTREDMLSGLMRFENGITGVLQINWLTPAKVRRLTVRGGGGMVVVDYITQDLTFYENGQALDNFQSLQIIRGISEGRVIREKVEKREPLRAELDNFVQAVREQRPPLVTGEDSLQALRIAAALIQAGQEHRMIEV
ncbi:MAG: Gfo/Idh/MocA family oxidoreductase [Anaerolineae bacterium]|nr:Gfo/Idh/MocA family oxidoreductase [Anaerolineae bacterium]